MTPRTDVDLDAYEFVATLAELPTKRGKVVTINEHEIAIFRVGGNVYAIGNICPHQHSPILAEGILVGETVTCPLHGWTFELATGNLPGGGRGVQSYEVAVVGDKVYVKRPEQPPFAFW